jgi:hypothetical protein
LADFEGSVVVAFIFIGLALSVGVFIYAWMASAGLPKVVAAPMGLVSFLVIIAALFGIPAVVIAAIKAISK